MNSNESLAPSDLIIDETSVAAVEAWLGACVSGDILVLTSESPGCGISTMLRVFQTHMKDRISMLYDEPLGFGSKTVLGQKKIIVLDPLDEYMTDQTKQRRAISLVEQRRVPIIITGIRRRVSIARVSDMFGTVAKKKGVTMLHIPTPDRDRVIEILTKHGIKDPASMWDSSGNDFRHCLAAASMSASTTTCVRTIAPDGLEALSRLLQKARPQDTFADAARMADGDIHLLIDGVFENYARGVDHGGTDFDTVHTVLDVLATCDQLQQYVYHDPSSEFPEIAGMIGGIEFLPIDVGASSSIKKHGTVWAKENHKHTKQKLHRVLTSQGIQPDTLPYIRDMVFKDTATQAPRLAKTYSPQIVWNATRLWMQGARDAGYTKARHDALTSLKNLKRARRY